MAAPTYRSTTLRLFIEHCPLALEKARRGEPRDTSIFGVGIAAHAVLQATTERRDIASCVQMLISNGREFDGVPEPPLAPDDVFAGREIALAWRETNPAPKQGQAEVALAIDAKGAAIEYASPRARYRMLIDEIERVRIDGADVAVITEYKTAWPTDASALDGIQSRGQAVGVAQHFPEVEWIIRRVVNLRTQVPYEDGIAPGDPKIKRWAKDILATCDAADQTKDPRPGAWCKGCPYRGTCEFAWAAVVSGTKLEAALGQLEAEPDRRRYVALKAAIIEAIRDEVIGDARGYCEQAPIKIPGGEVGYIAKQRSAPAIDADRKVALAWFAPPPGTEEQWCEDNAEILGLLAAAELGVTQIRKIAKALFDNRADREGFEATTIIDRKIAEFGVKSEPLEVFGEEEA